MSWMPGKTGLWTNMFLTMIGSTRIAEESQLAIYDTNLFEFGFVLSGGLRD
jgi:hypothetical protein